MFDSVDPYVALLTTLRSAGSMTNSEARAATGLDAASLRPQFKRVVAEGTAIVRGQARGAWYVAVYKGQS